MSLLNISIGLPTICRIFYRSLHKSAILLGSDAREKRLGHIKKTDNLEGEYAAVGATEGSFEFIDDNLMEKVIDSVKFKDIPIIHIICTRNNTKMALTDGNGRRRALKSGGTEGYKHCRKGTTVAAQAVANRIITYAEDHDINMARLVFNGLGPGRNAAYKVLEMSNIKIVSLSDRTEAIEPWIKRPRATKSI